MPLKKMNIPLKRVWKVGKQLGNGGFGRVFEAESDDGQRAAIKLVPKQPGAARELLFEDLTGVRGVVPILDSGEFEDQLVIVMPIATRSLRAHLAEQKRLTPAEVITILSEIAQALSDLKGKVIHRDIKPDNILLLDGHWCLSDFGISRYVAASTSVDTHKWAWSSPYNPPERWREERAIPASDIYSLGITAYELLSGRWPFLGPDFRAQHLNEAAPALTGVPIQLASLVTECLFKAPEVRPTPASLVARLPLISKPTSQAAGQLQAAHQAHIEKEARKAAAKSAEMSAAERRRAIHLAATRVLEMLADELLQSISENAPTARIENHGRSSALPKSVSLGNAQLSISAANPFNGEDWGGAKPAFDVIAIAAIDLRTPEDRSQYQGRSHSLWYCDAMEAGVYRWYETAFMFNPFLGKARNQDPFALAPGIGAGQAINPIMAEFQVAWPFTPLEAGNVAEFIERWMGWFAQASQGRLGRPSTMPEREAGGSWRRQ